MRGWFPLLLLSTALCCGPASAADTAPAAAPASSTSPAPSVGPDPTPAPAAIPAPPVPTETPRVADADFITFLSRAIAWYRGLSGGTTLVTDPDDVVYFDSIRDQALQVLQLGFESARTQLSVAPSPPQTNQTYTDAQKRAAQSAASARDRVAKLQPLLDQAEKRLQEATDADRAELTETRDRIERTIGFFRTYLVINQSYQSFLKEPNGNGHASLVDKIPELEQSVPELKEAVAKSVAKPPPANTALPSLDRLALDLFDLIRKSRAIDDLAAQTAEFQKAVTTLREPLRTGIRGVMARGRAIADQDIAGSAPPAAAPRATPAELEQLTTIYQQAAAVNVPLSKQERMLDTLIGYTGDWRASVNRHTMVAARALGLRVGALLVAIGAVLLLAMLWRKATFKYVHDPRRRRQLMMVRRIVVSIVSTVIVLSAFVSDLSSWATVAGFATAGVAVALQSLILSVVAYFFLIGRYGVRAGDRVTIAGVTGDIIEVGLVRLYLAELTGEAGDVHPTGRVVLFPNSVIFQASANFYKQLPGTDYTWHELALSLDPESDLALAEKQLIGAAESELAGYREALSRQHKRASEAMNMEVEVPRASGRLRFKGSTLEFVLRYPVELRHATEMDDRITRALVRAIEGTPGLRLGESGHSMIGPEPVGPPRTA
jgi:Mechanosensitive ion channel